jgi:hypothetical protein
MPRKSSKPQAPVAAAAVATPAIAAAPRGRASWSGMLRLSLVTVPVKAYPAASSTEALLLPPRAAQEPLISGVFP